LKVRDRVGRRVYENAAVPEIDASDEPGAPSNSRRSPRVVDLQLDSREAFYRGEDGFQGSHHRDETSGSRSIRTVSRSVATAPEVLRQSRRHGLPG
jgi:hypothetical protein